jgi:AcrR family transcriptional regulator
MSTPEKRAGARKRSGPTGPARERRGSAGSARERTDSGGSARERVSGIQRQRLLAAMAEVTAERGAGQVTVAHIVARSGVSRRTFYEQFADREDCLLAALDEAIEQATAAVLPAYEAQTRWRERIGAGLAALLAFLDEEPAMARLVVVEALGAGPRALQRRTRIVRALIAAVDEGRAEARAGREPPALAAEGVVGAILAVVHARLLEEHTEPLSALTAQLMSTVVLPYLGAAAAQRELDRPLPLPPKTNRRARRDPLEGLDMRLTYRTVRVLMAIGGHSGASNRQVAAVAGIADQGQISKLLTRLQNLGLVENAGEGQIRGAPNAWRLTAKGAEVEHAIRGQTERERVAGCAGP